MKLLQSTTGRRRQCRRGEGSKEKGGSGQGNLKLNHVTRSLGLGRTKNLQYPERLRALADSQELTNLPRMSYGTENLD